MTDAIPDRKRDPDTPEEVEIRDSPRPPETDPTLGIAVTLPPQAEPPHRLVTIGDSLTHGFQSGAVFNTDVSYPSIIAAELGWGEFRYPRYDGFGGLPINIELLVRDLERRYGRRLDWWELPLALFHARRRMDEIEDYWERGPGAAPPRLAAVNHNLAVYGWDLRDALERTTATLRAELDRPRDNLIRQFVENAGERAALRVLPGFDDAAARHTVFTAAAALGAEAGGGGDGIETLVVFLGANNALQTITQLRVRWSDTGYDTLAGKKAYTVWRPSHFAAEFDRVAEQVRGIRARHVIWCTVPHVTIAPLARGVGTKVEPGSRYFPYYTRPWVEARDFHPGQDAHLTANQARAIDSAIDQYNSHIVDTVRAARRDGRDWLLLDTCGLLDRLAARRYLEDPAARPPWWHPYPLPPELRALDPVPDSRFLGSDGTRRTAGGLFSLDGVHPTTIAYGVLAQEVITVMRAAGVQFRLPDDRTVRPDPVRVDFARLLRRDTLVTAPPGNLSSGLGILRWADEAVDLLRRALYFRW
jgi:hypothetical protein